MSGDTETMAMQIDISGAVAQDVKRLSQALNLSESQVIEKVLRHFLENEGRDALDVAAAIEDVETGKTHAFDSVMDEVRYINGGRAA